MRFRERFKTCLAQMHETLQKQQEPAGQLADETHPLHIAVRLPNGQRYQVRWLQTPYRPQICAKQRGPANRVPWGKLCGPYLYALHKGCRRVYIPLSHPDAAAAIAAAVDKCDHPQARAALIAAEGRAYNSQLTRSFTHGLPPPEVPPHTAKHPCHDQRAAASEQQAASSQKEE